MPDYSSQHQTPKAEAPARLEDIHSRLTNMNDRQCDLLYQLEEKLNKIYDKRSPENEKAVEQTKTNDAISSMNEQVNRVASQNKWIEKLVAHISELI